MKLAPFLNTSFTHPLRFCALTDLATFIGGFKSTGELRNNPIGLPISWHFEAYHDVLSATTWRYALNSLNIAFLRSS
ncbi:MAG: hypothetical protein R2865_10260 [Deinococcales bacterium]